LAASTTIMTALAATNPAITARMLRITLHIRPPATCHEARNLG
jgi:hypothetical protein